MELQTNVLSIFANVLVFVDEMKQLGVDFQSILQNAGLPPITLKKRESMMSVISTFERHYIEAEDLELKL